MNECNNFNCPNMNIRGYCNVTACTKQYNNFINNMDNIITFPYIVGGKTFYSRKELEDYILMTQNEDYGRGIWC